MCADDAKVRNGISDKIDSFVGSWYTKTARVRSGSARRMVSAAEATSQRRPQWERWCNGYRRQLLSRWPP